MTIDPVELTGVPAEIKLIRHMAADDYVIQAAQVSAKGENDPKVVPPRFINALMSQRHGSPFEHTAFTFFVKAPLFTFREWQRHRVSSFNEMSGRYTELLPEFYQPYLDRKVKNVGTKMKPEFIVDEPLTKEVQDSVSFVSHSAWSEYQRLLEKDVAPEVARMVLPLNIMSQMYWTVNARSLMNFLSLRVQSEASLVRSYPQYEIDEAAQVVEKAFAEAMPLTHEAFVNNGRVAP